MRRLTSLHTCRIMQRTNPLPHSRAMQTERLPMATATSVRLITLATLTPIHVDLRVAVSHRAPRPEAALFRTTPSQRRTMRLTILHRFLL